MDYPVEESMKPKHSYEVKPKVGDFVLSRMCAIKAI